MALDLEAYRAALATRAERARIERDAFDRAAKAQRATSPEERALALAERIESHPELADALADAGADVSALVAYHAGNVATAARAGTERTERLDARGTAERGSVPVARTMARECPRRCGACEACIACTWAPLDGAPVGAPESLQAAKRERAAADNERQWAERGRRAAKQNARRTEQRARAKSPLHKLQATNRALECK